MADEEKNEEKGQEQPSQAPSKKGASKLLAWLLPVGVVAVCAGMGFFVGRFFGTRGAAQNVSAAQQSDQNDPDQSTATVVDTGPGWYYDIEPIIGNLTDTGVMHYIRISVTLEVGGMSQKEGTAFLDQKIPVVRNLMLLYLNSLSSEDVQGEQNLRRMQSQITDLLNQNLFNGTDGVVKQVLFREKSLS
jgi:flagellar basal body-associated protein FliL